METAASISISEYLNTSYRPDQEWLDGKLAERNLGEYDHSSLQGALVGFLGQQEREWGIRVLPGQRIRISPTRFRVPDICVMKREQPVEQVFTKPPLVCIEVVSEDDRLRDIQERIDDYRVFGVPHIWLLDGVMRQAYVCDGGDFREPKNDILEVAGSPIRIPLIDLFADLH